MGKFGREKARAKASTADAAGNKQGLVFNKDFGQHILKNPLVTTSIVEKARVSLFSL